MRKMKPQLLIFHGITMLQSIANNLAHPVTPAFINNLQLRDSMFGFAFAAMSAGIFLFSLFWGELSSRIKKTTILMISMVGYGIAQYFFMISTTSWMIVTARFLAGFFTGGFQVAQLNYLVSQNQVEDRGYHLTLSSILVIASSTVGYFIGGLVGDRSIQLAFQIQVVLSIIVGLLYYFVLNRTEITEEASSFRLKNLNPFKVFVSAKGLITPLTTTLMLAVLMAWIASISFDQSFNYYIRDMFQFPPSYNGYLKIAGGLVGVIANFTIAMYLIEKTRIHRSYSILMGIMATTGLIAVSANNLWLFIIASFSFIALDAMSKPVQQAIVSGISSDYKESHVLMGLYNTMRSLGMIGGALFAGLIYENVKIGPFIFASVVILVGAILMGWVYRQLARD